MGGVTRATGAELEQVARIGAAGFYDDPVLSWVFPDPATRFERLVMAFTGVAPDYIERGVVELLDDACVALWREPGFDHHEALAEEPDEDEVPLFSPDELERLGVLTGLMTEQHPRDPHWYLFVVSTVPERQGQGLGTRILSPMCSRFDADGTPAHLESTNPRNMALYRRLGFEQSGEMALPGGPSLYPMWRSPQ